MPNVPNVPGVPALSSYAANDAELLTADAVIALNALLQIPQWGIYDDDGNPIITPNTLLNQTINSVLSDVAAIAALVGVPNIVPTTASTIEFAFSADSPISNYPQEQGAFQSYDKVQLPSEITLKLACGGQTSQRQAFLNTLQSLRTSTAVVNILTPEQFYTDYNLTHYEFVRTATNGVQLIVATCRFELIPFSASTSFTNTQQPGESAQQSSGVVQTLTPNNYIQQNFGGPLMLLIPAQPIPNQTLQVQLGTQACTLNIYQFAYGLFMDVYVGSTLIVAGVICLDETLIVRSEYLGFDGDLAFFDTQGATDPAYTGLGSRYVLLYLTETDVAALDLPVGVE